jgi:glycosyltransferase involved in cell wall biosynthesis
MTVARQLCEIPDKPTFLYVGRLSPDKNLGVLLEAWSQFSRSHDANLVIVGEGPLMGQVESWRRGLENPFSVILAGYQDDPALYYAAADVLVFPSRRETFGNVIVEAMSHGLPVLTTVVGVVKEWEDHKAMLATFDPDRASELSERMKQLVTDHEERERLGRNARRFIAERYDLGRIVDRYQQIYMEALQT